MLLAQTNNISDYETADRILGHRFLTPMHMHALGYPFEADYLHRLLFSLPDIPDLERLAEEQQILVPGPEIEINETNRRSYPMLDDSPKQTRPLIGTVKPGWFALDTRNTMGTNVTPIATPLEQRYALSAYVLNAFISQRIKLLDIDGAQIDVNTHVSVTRFH